MSFSKDQYREALESLFDGPLPPALESALSAPAEPGAAHDLEGLLQVASQLDAWGETFCEQLPEIELWENIATKLDPAASTPLDCDHERIGQYLDDTLSLSGRIAFENDLEAYPHLADDLKDALALKHECLAIGPRLRRRIPAVDLVNDVTTRAASLVQQDEKDDLDAIGIALEQLGESVARSLPTIDVHDAVMSAVRNRQGQKQPDRIVPFAARRLAQRNWQRWGILAATFAMMALVGATVYLAGYNQGNRVQLASQPSPAPAAPAASAEPRATENDFGVAAQPVLPGETHVVANAEESAEAPGPRSASRRKDTTWEDVLTARRNAMTDKSALEKLQQWASLSREEILDLLEEGGLDPEVIAGAAQFLPPEEAVALLEDLVQKYPDDPYFRAALARNLAASGESALAQQHLADWADLEPGNGLPRYMEANLRFADGDVEGGLDALYRASSANYANPHSVAAAYERESALIAAGYDRDTARFLAALSAGSNESQELSQLGEDFGRYARNFSDNGDFDSAEQVALGIVTLGQQMARSAQTTNDFASGIALQQEGLAALSGLYALFGVNNPNLLSQLTAEVVAGLNQLTTMLQQLNAVINSPDLQLINSLLDLIMQGAELTFFAP